MNSMLKIHPTFFFSSLFFCGTLLHAGASPSNLESSLPNPLIIIGKYLVYTFYTMSVLSWFLAMRGKIKFRNSPATFFILAYIPLLLYAIAENNDIVRYLSIILLILTTTVFFEKHFKQYSTEELIGFTIPGVILFVIVSIIYSIDPYNSGLRISGYMTNPNGFALALVVSGILLSAHKFNYLIFILLAHSTLFSLILFSGSKASMIAYGLVILFFLKQKNTSTFVKFFFLSLILLVSFHAEDNLLQSRAFQLDAASLLESGRGELNSKSLLLIKDSPFIGHGMTKHEELLATGNVHNSYTRIFLMVGIPFGVLYFAFLFYGLLLAYFFSPENNTKVFWIIVPIISVGEDYLVGIGSFFFLTFILMLSFLKTNRLNSNKKWK